MGHFMITILGISKEKETDNQPGRQDNLDSKTDELKVKSPHGQLCAASLRSHERRSDRSQAPGLRRPRAWYALATPNHLWLPCARPLPDLGLCLYRFCRLETHFLTQLNLQLSAQTSFLQPSPSGPTHWGKGTLSSSWQGPHAHRYH